MFNTQFAEKSYFVAQLSPDLIKISEDKSYSAVY